MTTIAVLGWFPSMPEDLARHVPDDRIVRFERRGPFDGAAEIEIALGAPAPDLIRDFLAEALGRIGHDVEAFADGAAAASAISWRGTVTTASCTSCSMR